VPTALFNEENKFLGGDIMGDAVSGGNASRRTFLRAAAAVGSASLLPAISTRRAFADETLALAYSVNTLSSPSQSQQVKGGVVFARSVGKSLNTLLTGGNSDKGIGDVQAILAKYNGKVALMIDPLDTPDARIVIEACEKAGAHLVTIWNKPDDIHVWDSPGTYVAHISFDGVRSGKVTAESLFAAMGGQGKIVALGGMASNQTAIDRKTGMQKAVDASSGKVKLLDFQVGDWASSRAFSITQAWLTRYGDDINGIWAANDEMALGAIQALKSEGLNGKIKVCAIDGTPPGFDAVQAGDMVCTLDWHPYLWGGLGLSLAYKAATGQYDPTTAPKGHREFFGKTTLVDASNVKAARAAVANSPTVDYATVWDYLQT
jgi:ribose transport system substrate-binding protein